MALHDVQLAEMSIRQDLAEVKQTSGVLLWKVTDFANRLHSAVSGRIPSFYSPPFYTSPCGYKLCARLYPNGDGLGRGTHLSLFVVVMRGEFDSLLPWPFLHKISLSLLDQNRANPRHVVETFRPNPSSSSFQRPQAETNIALGCPHFLAKSALQNGYLVDDTLYIKVTLHTNGLTAPGSNAL